jgi:hypothetical protein
MEMLQWYADLSRRESPGQHLRPIETDLVVAELFAWIWWEDLSYLEGLDTEATQRLGQHVHPTLGQDQRGPPGTVCTDTDATTRDV